MEKLRADLEASYRLPAAAGAYKATQTGMLTIAAAIAAAMAAGGVITVSQARNLNRLTKVPVVFWGNDVREITEHQFKAITGSGYTIHNTSGAIGQSLPISPALNRYGAGHPRSWMYRQPQSAGRSLKLGLDTDEFPYAKTIQGGFTNYQFGFVSLHVLNASQNRSNGSRLDKFWNKPTVQVTTYEADRRNSLFLNIPVPGLGMSFGLDRNMNPVSV